jgi:hypothetical protein
MVMADLYDRQKELELNIPEKVLIIGVGGIGSWVALNMALIGTKNLYLIDFDKIEQHNLNRTPFRTLDIDEDKTNAVMDLIMERRDETEIRLFNKRIEELTNVEMQELKDCLIIDCRDVLDELPEALMNNKRVKLGYDGLSTTIMINPDFSSIWELEPEQRGYEIVPSFLAPCQYLASAITTIVTSIDFNIESINNKIITIDIKDHFLNIIK